MSVLLVDTNIVSIVFNQHHSLGRNASRLLLGISCSFLS